MYLVFNCNKGYVARCVENKSNKLFCIFAYLLCSKKMRFYTFSHRTREKDACNTLLNVFQGEKQTLRECMARFAMIVKGIDNLTPLPIQQEVYLILKGAKALASPHLMCLTSTSVGNNGKYASTTTTMVTPQLIVGLWPRPLMN